MSDISYFVGTRLPLWSSEAKVSVLVNKACNCLNIFVAAQEGCQVT